jgi:hypothetical protein
LAPILVSFSRRLVNDHGSAVSGIASVGLVCQRVELKADGVGSKGAALQAGPLDRTLALL